MAKKKKVKVPKSVLELRWSPKKFAKKNNIRVSGKGMSKGEKKRNKKRLRNEYSEHAITGLNRAVKIISENSPESKKMDKVKDAVDNIISNPEVMKRVAKIYAKHPKNYPNMKFLPHMIMNTILYYAQDNLDGEDKEIADALDKEGLVKFCEKILKGEIRRYKKAGTSSDVAYQLATVVPTTKLLKNNRQWYKNLIQSLYFIAENDEVDLGVVLPAIQKIDKKKSMEKRDFYEGFYLEFIFTKSSNKKNLWNDSQKELHENLIDKTLEYLDGLKSRKCKDILKAYIKRRKTAESYKNDNTRVIKFVDYANSNSSFTNLKAVVQELISDNDQNEMYLS